MEYLCNYLNTYYNTNICKSLSPTVQKILREIASKNAKNITANIPLIKLVNNLYTISPPTPDYISGPYTLSYHYSKKYHKAIYVFGEAHGIKNNCNDFPQFRKNSMKIDDFLSMVFDSTPVFIDFYMEIWSTPYNPTVSDNSSYLNRIRRTI